MRKHLYSVVLLAGFTALVSPLPVSAQDSVVSEIQSVDLKGDDVIKVKADPSRGFNYPFAEYRKLEKVHINGIYCYGDNEHPEWLRQSLRKNRFLIAIEEWLSGQDHRQLGEFVDNAGFSFILRAKGRPDIVINRNNFSGTRTSRGGRKAFQAFYVHLRSEQQKALIPGIPYTIHPQNQSDKYTWHVNENVRLAWPLNYEDKIREALNSIAPKIETRAGLQDTVRILNAMGCSIEINGIQQKIDFRIQAEPRDIAAVPEIQLKAEGLSVMELLMIICHRASFTYRIAGTTVFIEKK
jgi:hypothetical protein